LTYYPSDCRPSSSRHANPSVGDGCTIRHQVRKAKPSSPRCLFHYRSPGVNETTIVRLRTMHIYLVVGSVAPGQPPGRHAQVEVRRTVRSHNKSRLHIMSPSLAYLGVLCRYWRRLLLLIMRAIFMKWPGERLLNSVVDRKLINEGHGHVSFPL